MNRDADLKSVDEINERQREFFNRRVNVFEPPLPEGVPERLKIIVKAGNIQPGDVVLDVGTGTGILIYDILDYEPSTIHACDLAERMLERVREKFPQVVTHLCDIKDLDLPDGSLDVVYINGCFSNIAEKDKSMSNIHRMLRPGGRLVISHPLGRAFIHELKVYAPFPLDLLPDRDEATELFAKHGFALVEYRDEPEFYLVVGKTREPAEKAGNIN